MNTQELIRRFLDGETTVEEERELCRRFRQGPVPPDLQPYAEFFCDMAVLPVSDVPVRRLSVVWRWAAAAAVTVVFVLGGAGLQMRLDNRMLTQNYEGSYMIVDGKRTDNLSQIRDEIGTLLADADRIEAHAGMQQVIGDAEREVLESVPAGQRKEMERLLNE